MRAARVSEQTVGSRPGRKCSEVSRRRLLSCRLRVDGFSVKEPLMRGFVAGATGAIGRQVVARLGAAGRVKPDVIVHQLTAIGAIDPRHVERDFAPTNRLRTEGTDHLVSAAQAVGVRRFVAQSNGAFCYGRTGGGSREQEPLE